MILTIDIGNSRIKWALWKNDEIVVRVAVEYESDNCVVAFDQLFVDIRPYLQRDENLPQSSAEYSSNQKPSQVSAICVAGDSVRNALTAWVKQQWGLAVEYLQTQKQCKKIINAYDDPSQHGVDRWVCLIEACRRYPESSVCVIGAGTAITFDFIMRGGQHLGGYILPSFATMHDALSKDTAKVNSILETECKKTAVEKPAAEKPAAEKQVVPNNTNDAVNQGLHKLLQAGIRDLCQHAKDELGESMQIIITGGFAPVILRYTDMPEMKHEPDLIMNGIYNIVKTQKL